MDTVDKIINLLAFSAIIPIALNIYYYGTRPRTARSKYLRRPSWRWRETQIGRTLMYQNVAWLAYLIFIVSSLIDNDWPGRWVIRAILYLAIVTLFWRSFLTLRHTQKQPMESYSSSGLNLDSDIEDTRPRRPETKAGS